MNFQQTATDRLLWMQNIVGYFDRWKDELDGSCIPPYTHALITTPARDLYSGRIPHRVNSKSTLVDVLQCFTSSRTVLIDRADLGEFDKNVHSELLFGRLTFLEQALLAPSLLDPLSTLVNSVPSIGFVRGNETLDVAVTRMLDTGFEEVGVIDGGVISFVLHIDDIFDFIFKEGVKIGAVITPKDSTFKGSDERDEDILVVETNAELQERIAREKSLCVMSPFQLSAQQFCKMYWTEVLMVICILLDVSCAIFDYSSTASDTSSNDKLQVATGIILFVFMYEALVRVFGFRWALLRLPFDIIDLAIVLVSVIIYCMVLRDLLTTDSKSVMTMTRIIRGLRMFKVIKLVVNVLMKQRMMYHQDGFALDLSFVTNSCIAMSRPTIGATAGFANPIDEVCRFFNTKYPDRFLIFDLGTVARYSEEQFGGRVERIAVEKHNPPRMAQMVAFVERVGKVLDEDPKTCIAVHCKSGRDRTGVMVAAWLMYSGFAESAEDAMTWFVSCRIGPHAKVSEGIPMPSQQRYARYMEAALGAGGFNTPRPRVRRISLTACPDMDGRGGSCLWAVVHEDGQEVFNTIAESRDRLLVVGPDTAAAEFELDLPVAGDVRITIFNRDPTSGRDELCCFVCFHTGFITAEREVFPKEAVDVAASDTKCKVFAADFAMVLEFESVDSFGSGAASAGRSKSRLASFRKIVRPSRKVVEEAARMRGRNAAVQRRFALRLKRKVLFGSRSKSGLSQVGVGANADMVEMGVSMDDGLCCAKGPKVEHDAVDLFQDRDGAVKANSYTYRQLSQIISNTIGARIARSLVSGNKLRFVEDGFDLDLTYITARVIAMGFPSSGIESSYRNSMADVYRFFQERHAAHYLIVNLCSERAYSLDTFHGNCVRYPFPDHNPPALELILPCCSCIHKFLQEDPDNVVAIHCKAGKGRTGLMVVAYLLYCGFRSSATDARAFYDWARTVDGKGLTIISQIRYVHYFEQQLRVIKERHHPIETEQARAPACLVRRLRIHTTPHFNSDGSCDPSITIDVKSEVDHEAYCVFQSLSARRTSGERSGSQDSNVRPRSSFEATYKRTGTIAAPADFKDVKTESEPGVGTRVAGDFKVTFYDDGRSKVMFFFWLHSAFLTQPPPEMAGKSRQLKEEECRSEGLPQPTWSLMLSKHEIDKAAKDSRCAHFDPDFRVELFFTPLLGESGTGLTLEAARANALTRTESSGDNMERPLHADKEAYQKYLKTASAAGRPELSFQAWLLGGDLGDANGSGATPLSPASLPGSSLVFTSGINEV